MRVVVVGAGVMGLATAWQLTRGGIRPTVLDRFARGHHEGASHGATRNFNNAYAEAHYLDLLESAARGWDDLGRVDGEPLLRRHGLVSHGPAPALGSVDADLESIHRALGARGIRSELMSGGDAARRWPGMRFEDLVLFSPDAGVARAAAALTELERRVVAGGGSVRWSTPVMRIDDDGEGVSLTTGEEDVLRADIAVVTAGAWTQTLLPHVPLPRLTVTEESPAHFAAQGGASVWPSFNHFVTGTGYPGIVYGMPTPGEGVKVGFHGVGHEVDPDRRPHSPSHATALKDYVREWLPGLDADTAVPISCTYTSTDGGAFVLDRVGRVVVGAGFSGHGFKFAPGVGATLADLALDPAALAAEPFRLR